MDLNYLFVVLVATPINEPPTTNSAAPKPTIMSFKLSISCIAPRRTMQAPAKRIADAENREPLSECEIDFFGLADFFVVFAIFYFLFILITLSITRMH